MQVLRSAGLFAANVLWRATRSKSAGRVLVNALAADDPNVRTIAGMLLVRGGKDAVPLIQEAIRRQLNLPQTLVMAGDIGAVSLEPDLQKFVDHPDPTVSQAARDALRILELQKKADVK
jgi:hypothetical protein